MFDQRRLEVSLGFGCILCLLLLLFVLRLGLGGLDGLLHSAVLRRFLLGLFGLLQGLLRFLACLRRLLPVRLFPRFLHLFQRFLDFLRLFYFLLLVDRRHFGITDLGNLVLQQ